MSTQIQIRRDTTANWENVDPILADGEIGFDTTVNRFKVGNGVKAWSELDYSGSSGSSLVDGAAYIRLEDDSWVASPSMTLEGDLNIGGNIVIDGEIVDPDGNPSGGGGGGGGGVFSNVEVITSSRASWPIPATAIKVTVVGGGGGSPTGTSDSGTAGGTTSVERQDGTKLAAATGGEQGYKQQQKAKSALGGKGTIGDIKIIGDSGEFSADAKVGPRGGSSTHGGGGQGAYAASPSQSGGKGGYGAGGGSSSGTVFCSSGAAGGTAIAYLNDLTVGDTLKLTVGAGGSVNGAAGVIIFEY